MSYLNSVTFVGFVGADPEQRQSRNNGANFTVFSVATQRSWKNAQDEWVLEDRVASRRIFRPRLAEYVAQAIKKGSHVLVEGCLISSTYEQPERQKQENQTTKITSWSIRADAVRKLDRGEPEPEAVASDSRVSDQAPEPTDAASF